MALRCPKIVRGVEVLENEATTPAAFVNEFGRLVEEGSFEVDVWIQEEDVEVFLGMIWREMLRRP